MTVELDRIFICAEVGAPEADRLVDFGLAEGTSNLHLGQGTTNRRFFHNAMLELLWVRDEPEVRSTPIASARLWEWWRYRYTGTRLSVSAYARARGTRWPTASLCPVRCVHWTEPALYLSSWATIIWQRSNSITVARPKRRLPSVATAALSLVINTKPDSPCLGRRTSEIYNLSRESGIVND